ncbi:hypothetical protein U1Q18_024063 [Sarracenia purpurea var. burkii]
MHLVNKEDINRVVEDDPGVIKADSSERAQIAVDLLEEKSRADTFETFGHSEILESSMIGFEVSGGKSDKTLNIPCSKGVENCAHAKTLNETAEPISEISPVQVTSLFVVKDRLDFRQIL